MTDFEKLGQFYLGKPHDLKTGVTAADDLVMYNSRDLTTHAVCVGMTGSGKTGLCLSLLEEAAIDGIPAICIDPKGDLGNLMLTFPGLAPEDFQPWIDPDEALRHGRTVQEQARVTADLWRRGLSEWGQSGDRIQRFRDAAEVAIYTPASSAGRPLTVLKSFDAPQIQGPGTADAFREHIMGAVSGLLALLQIDADPITSREHILLSSVLDHFWKDGQNVDMATLIRSIQTPPFTKVGFLSLESFYSAADRFQLAMSLNNLLASPSFAAWREGESLSIPRLLYTPEGKPRLAVISIAHLSDAERMFFVTILLNEVVSWMRTQPGTTSLRALLYMDEVFGFFPPVANPPSKGPMLTLLKQARAYGLGCVLATQNPADLDYKGLSNCGTWFLGRLQTERDKLRVLEGLEGAATSTGDPFDRAAMEQTLASLGSRTFLMNNVHESGTVVFRSRWALSYLRGPLTRQQIECLMIPLKTSNPAAARSAAFSAPVREPDAGGSRPVLPPEISELFFPVRRTAEKLVYRPALLGQVRVHYVDARKEIDQWDQVTLLGLTVDAPAGDPWDEAEEWDESELPEMHSEPADDAAVYHPLPAEMLQKKSYSSWETSLRNYVFRHQKLTLSLAPVLKECSRPGESDSDFRIRLRHAAREQRDLQVEKLRARYASRFSTLEDQIRRQQQRVETEKSQTSEKRLSAAVTIGSSILGALFGRRLRSSANVSRAGAAIRSASRAAKESADVRHASDTLQALLQKQADLTATVEQAAQEIQDQFDPDLMDIQQIEISPRKSDLSVLVLSLVWLPFRLLPTQEAERAF